MSECNLPDNSSVDLSVELCEAQALLIVLYRHLLDMLTSSDLDGESLMERAEQGLIICRLVKERLDAIVHNTFGGRP